MTDMRQMGPIDWLLIEFSEPLTGKAVPPLLDLVDRGLIRILDIMFIRKLADGSVHGVDIGDLPTEEAASVEVFDGARSGLLGQDDLAAAGAVLEPDSRAILLVFENAWAAPLAVALREAGGVLVDSGRIPIQSIVAALDELNELESEPA